MSVFGPCSLASTGTTTLSMSAGRVGTGYGQKILSSIFPRHQSPGRREQPVQRRQCAEKDARRSWAFRSPSPRRRSGPTPATAVRSVDVPTRATGRARRTFRVDHATAHARAPWKTSQGARRCNNSIETGGGTRNCFWQNNPMQSRTPRDRRDGTERRHRDRALQRHRRGILLCMGLFCKKQFRVPLRA
jgi:hypothetical protein